MISNTFCTEERLKSHHTIGRLFREGHSFGMYPLRVVWVEAEAIQTAYPAQLAVSVPKRSFRKAVDRNRLKRKIRESYRLHKNEFYHHLPASSPPFALMIIYTAKKTLPFADIDSAMLRLLPRLSRKINSGS